jgi:CBS domain-containing protein
MHADSVIKSCAASRACDRKKGIVMRIQEIMSKRVETASPSLTAGAALLQMKSGRIRHLVVVDSGKVVGIVSDRDLRGASSRDDLNSKRVGELMTPQVVSIQPTTTLREAANLLRGHKIGCLPVFDREKLAGIITVSDLLDLIGRGCERPVAKSRRWTLKHRGPRRRQQKTI